MQRGGTYVEIFFLATTMQDPERQHICQQPGDGNHHHGHTSHRLGVIETLHCLPDDQNDNKQQRDGVHEGGEGSKTQPTEGVACARWPTSKVDCQQGKQQGGGVGQHVPCIG